MITQGQVQDLILIAESYSLELTEEMLLEQIDGCVDCGDIAKINQLIILNEQLKYKISINEYGIETENLYSCLLDAVSKFSGASIIVDSNSSTPNTIIDVTIISDGKPAWFDFNWSQMEIADQDADGGRYTYINPILDGWNPSLQTGTTLLYLGIDYDMFDGGVVKFKTGKGIYEGQSIRADNFQPYNAPPLPIPIGTALIDNLSSKSLTYSDNFAPSLILNAGQRLIKNPIINGQAFQISFPSLTTTTYTAYNSDGTVFQTTTFISPPSTGFNLNNMDITKRYEFIVRDTI